MGKKKKIKFYLKDDNAPVNQVPLRSGMSFSSAQGSYTKITQVFNGADSFAQTIEVTIVDPKSEQYTGKAITKKKDE